MRNFDEGYYVAASDGGILTFGDANFAGSMGAAKLNKAVVSMAPDADGDGYWLVAADGEIFAFGDAPFTARSAVTHRRPPWWR